MNKNDKFSIGIVGFGFVGQAIAAGFSHTHNVKAYDIKNPADSFEETIDQSGFIFICLPTPMTKTDGGKISLKIIDPVIEKIAKYLNYKSNKIIVIKSTVIPGTTRKYQEKYPGLNFIFNPEFLTERSARLDFINTSRIVLGGKFQKDPNLKKIVGLYRVRFIQTPIFLTDFETAEFSKYLCNTFFIHKIMFFNEQRMIAAKSGKIDWDQAVSILLADGRVGNSHYDVPGHDGQLGFGGKCFPKDINAYLAWAKSIGAPASLLDADWRFNKKIRKVWDWLEIDGAVEKK